MKYPEQLVKKYGAKAGLLIYAAQHLPNIPQARMVVKTLEENVESFLARADAANISWPRIFRSSAICELDGYEGTFPTKVILDFETEHAKVTNPGYCGRYASKKIFDRELKLSIEYIENSPSIIFEEDFLNGPKPKNLGSKINVICAEKIPSYFTGTYIAHPNQDNVYLFSTSISRSMKSDNPINSNFISTNGKDVKIYENEWYNFSAPLFKKISKKYNLFEQLKTVMSWHDQINSLPELDSNWAYQIEFGLSPLCLFQVRPFKKKEKANFKLKKKSKLDQGLIVIGVTPPEGIDYRVVANVGFNLKYGIELDLTEDPTVYCEKMRSAWHFNELKNHKANIFEHSLGFLAHDDIRAMRAAKLNILLMSDFSNMFKTGDWVNIKSDGIDYVIKQIKKTENK
ncbi:hypothetical protein HOK51_11560 [Candidatus Woesearchaeota archaeon]|jgi:hypothetical protein|nr:hypothetical protein [Candidatus Woesearchaeota archaeon]MBT6520458.1 hypothetical protein [Candidatus Woesearchaeota archaeon]MBT7367352.1 hypothetical protein [Candidatus Woesearchaeota archaeon]